MKKKPAELDYALNTLLYRCSLYARNRSLARKYHLLIEQYGAALGYSQEKIQQRILTEQRRVLAVRRRREKVGMNYPKLHPEHIEFIREPSEINSEGSASSMS